MSRPLLDVNVVIALLDASHLFHARAHAWWGEHQKGGWASCPLTENGVVRVMSQPAYSRQVTFSIPQLIHALTTFRKQTDHQFWSDDLSLIDSETFDGRYLLSPRQVTDVYLLGLAVRHEGRLATFDHAIPWAAVRGAQADHLCIL